MSGPARVFEGASMFFLEKKAWQFLDGWLGSMPFLLDMQMNEWVMADLP